ncbi:hypothetical protein GGI20_005110 [Coemansia sp. BCRC 34301]|nr:hypothetical protein GGI20_005110 [Coemansia sp. BCRC 34301]
MSNALPALLRRRHCSRAVHPTNPLSCIYPNRTIYNVETPDCFFRRFTPDGNYLVAFNRSLTGLLVFHVINAAASVQQLADAAAADGKSEFWHFFQLAWSQSYTAIGESLHRDLCLLSSDNRFIIAVRLRRADFAMPLTAPPPNSLTCIKAMEDITVLVIDIQSSRLVDKREYPSDIIYLSGHNGVSLYADRLCLLSLKHQCLRILRIAYDGRLTDLHEIGWNTRDDDAVLEHSLHLRDMEYERSHPAPLPRCITIKRGMSASSACIDDADVARSIKRRKTLRSVPSFPARRWLNNPSTSSESSIRPALTPEAMDPGSSRLSATLSSPEPSLPHPLNYSFALRRLSRMVSPDLLTTSGLPIPFVFARSNEARTVRSQSDYNDDANVNSANAAPIVIPDGGVPVQSDAGIHVDSPATNNNNNNNNMVVDSLNPLLPVIADNATLMPLHTLRRLPPHYRLIFTRAMQPAGRLDALAESDTSLIEPSLTFVPHSGLKQRLLAALFMRARAKDDCGLALQFFYRTYRQYEGLVLWRAQFLSKTSLLLRFVPLQIATSRSNTQRSAAVSSFTVANSFTVLAEYDILSTSFGNIWDSADPAVCDEVENRLDVYRAPMASSNTLGLFSSAMAPSLANDVYLRDSFESSQQAIRTARSGGPVQAARKASVMLPYAPQCMQESPLLDPSRFKSNLRTRQLIEKYRPAPSTPIRFYDRHTGTVKFVLSPLPIYMSPLALVGTTDPLLSTQHQGILDDDEEEDDAPTVLPGGLMGMVMRSGAILLPSGGVDELALLPDSAGAPQSTPALAPTSNPLTQQQNGLPQQHGSSHKTNVAYLFHPTLPLVLSTRSDVSMTALPISNIHFWAG